MFARGARSLCACVCMRVLSEHIPGTFCAGSWAFSSPGVWGKMEKPSEYSTLSPPWAFGIREEGLLGEEH